MRRGSALDKKLATVALAALILLPIVALAQEQTGSVEGLITDQSGAALPGATVTLSGVSNPTKVTAVANDKGRYRFAAVRPGEYRVTATLDGFQPKELAGLRVNVGSRLVANLELAIGEMEEEIEVVSEPPIISFKSSDTSAVIAREWVEKLPVGRDFTSVVSQVGGANDEDDLLGGISIDGSSGAENRFFVDGMDTTNLQNGTSQKTLLTDFLEEVQVKAGGYNAEFGGSTGGVISVVTKSGHDRFQGDVHAYYDDNEFNGDLRPSLQRNPDTGDAEYITFDEDSSDRVEPGFTLGGPIVKGRSWFFVGYSPSFNDTRRTVSFRDGVTNTFLTESDFSYLSANASVVFGPASLKLSTNFSDRERNNVLPSLNGTGSSAVEDYDVDEENPNESYSLSFDWLPTPSVATNLRAGHFEYDSRELGFFTGTWTGFSTSSAGRPGDLFDGYPAALDRPLGNITPGNSGTLFDRFQRDIVHGDATFFLEDALGDHEIKVGGLFERIQNDVLDGYSNTRLLFYWGIPRTDLNGVPRSGLYGHYRVLQIATQGNVQADNTSLFAQDSWRPTDRLVLNFGVRMEAEKIPSFSDRADIPDPAIEFDYGDKIAPRLGFAYDVKGDGQWKAYGSFGIFYDNTKLEMPRGLFGGDRWVDWWFGLDTFDWESIAANCRIVNNSVDAGPPPGCPGEFLFAVDRRNVANDPANLLIDPNLKPLESREFTVGVEHLLGPRISVGARLVHKELVRTIEDVGLVDPVAQAEVFVISNPGEGVATNVLGPDFPNQPKPKRDYDALNLTLRKNYSNNWGLNASYTYSRLYGNYSGLASSDEDGRLSPNVNRFFDSLVGSFDSQGRAVFGRLGSDRPHQFKAQLLYRTPWGTTLGVDQLIASGTPLSTQYSISPGLPFFPFGRGDLGRTPAITQTDLAVSHELALSGRFEVELSLEVFNLFDEDTEIDFDRSALRQDLRLNEEQFFAGFDAAAEAAAVANDTLFGLANQFQGRRSMRLGVRFNF